MKTQRNCWYFSYSYYSAATGAEEWGELRRVQMARSHAASPTEACPGSTGHGTMVLPSSSHSLSVSGLFPDTRLRPAAAPRIFCPERSQGVGPARLKEVCTFSMA